VPAWWERDSIILIGVSAMLILLGSIGYFILKKKLKQRFLLAKVCAASYRAPCPLRLRLHRAFACHSHPTPPCSLVHPPSSSSRRRNDDDRARARRKRPLAVPAEAPSGTNKDCDSHILLNTLLSAS